MLMFTVPYRLLILWISVLKSDLKYPLCLSVSISLFLSLTYTLSLHVSIFAREPKNSFHVIVEMKFFFKHKAQYQSLSFIKQSN